MGKHFSPLAFVTEPPVFEVNGGVFHIRARSGDSCIEFAMSPRCFAQGLDRAKTAAERYARGEQNIVVDD